jgi:glycosyltransferase involved in cell wall biosynthesis
MLPIIEKQIPNVEFHVVGRSHPPFEKTLPNKKNLILHGYQADLAPFLAKADVFVLPFKMGGGLRLKSLTGLSTGLPIISTPLGIEGLAGRLNHEYLVTDQPKKFARMVVRVLQSTKLQKKLGKNALVYIARHHSKKGNAVFLNQYQQITQ